MNLEFGYFIAISLAAALTPGASTILAMNNGMNHGIIKSLSGVLGHFTGVAIYIACSILVLTGFMALDSDVIKVITIIGSLYILKLGVEIFRNGNDIKVHGAESTVNALVLFRRSMLTVLANPKAVLYFLAILPSVFLPDFGRVALIVFTIYSVSLISMITYTFCGIAIKNSNQHVLSKYIPKASGLILIFAGLAMAVTSII